jgi:PhnB protein
MSKKVQAIPKGYHSVTPSLAVRGAGQAIAFYKKALAADELMRFPAPDGSIMHAKLRIGDSIIVVMEEMPDQGARSPESNGGTSVGFFVYGEYVDARWERAIMAGARSISPLADQFWGDRSGCLEDPFGHRWWLSQQMEELTPEELKERGAAHFAHALAAK